MMRKGFSVALLAMMVCVFGLVRGAHAGITLDVVFKDPTSGGVLTIAAGDPGSGCVGPFGYDVATTGYCMDVIMRTDDDFVGVKFSVSYDRDDGLTLMQAREWLGIGVSWNFSAKTPVVAEDCAPFGGPGISDVGPGLLRDFDCVVGPPNNPPVAPAGTYNLGTIVWDTTGTTPGTELISAVFGSGDAVLPVINGNIILDYSPKVVLGSKILNIIPEPGTASLLGLGLLGLIVAGRRSRD